MAETKKPAFRLASSLFEVSSARNGIYGFVTVFTLLGTFVTVLAGALFCTVA